MPSAVVCDDDWMSRQVLRGLLVDAGYDVLEAEVATVALDIVRATRPEVLVLDVNLPGMSGLDILRDVRMRSPATAVVVVSSFDLSGVDVSAMGAVTLPKADLAKFDQVLADLRASENGAT